MVKCKEFLTVGLRWPGFVGIWFMDGKEMVGVWYGFGHGTDKQQHVKPLQNGDVNPKTVKIIVHLAKRT